MTNKPLLIPMLLALLVLVACQEVTAVELLAQTAVPNKSMQVKLDSETNIHESSAVGCPEAVAGTHQLVDTSQGVCFLYPANFDVFEFGDGIGYTLVISSLITYHKSPVIWVTFEPAYGRSLDEVTTQRLNGNAFRDARAHAITMGNELASMLDNLPGQDTRRRIVVIHGDLVVEIVIDHIGQSYGAAAEQAEAAYSMIVGSFRFIDIES